MARSTRNRPASNSMPRTAWAWAVAGVVLGGIPAMVAFAPAAWLTGQVARATGGQVQLLQPRGTVWSGSAQLLLTGGAASQDQAALPGRVQWQLRPGWTGLRAHLQASCCTPLPLQVAVQPRWGGASVAVSDGQSQWPAALLSGLGTPWNTLQLQGQLVLQTTGLTATWAAGRMALAGQAQLDARGMSTRLSTLRPIGSYRLALQGGEVPGITLTTLEGQLLLSGTGQWVGNRLRFAGEASAATPEREAALANLLNIIGRRSGARSIITVG